MTLPTRIAALIDDAPHAGLRGLPSFCTAHPGVLRALLAHAARRGLPVLIEATSNQVNQDGGYTGQAPDAFAAALRRMADEAGAGDQLILGGDHLGPNPWRRLPAEAAMAKGEALVAAFAAAGATKIHLDASMALGGEAQPTPVAVAARAARLASAAEGAAPDPARLRYVIGTEVPTPGGEADGHALAVTTPASLAQTLATHRDAFLAQDLQGAFDRVAGVVVQPGVEFGVTDLAVFDPPAACDLVAALPADGPAFEAHSTDYQPDESLAALVRDRFAILKVGPELTFAWREALLALDQAEAWLRPDARSGAVAAVLKAMRENPSEWEGHYRSGGAMSPDVALLFGLSDRVRYYWARPAVAAAVDRLVEGLPEGAIPRPLLRQVLPRIDAGLHPGAPSPAAAAILARAVEAVADRYWAACGA